MELDRVIVDSWVQWLTPLLAHAPDPAGHLVGDRWQVDEISMKIAGRGATSP